jgi:hypothetical protein
LNLFKKALALGSGAQNELFDEKTRGQKSTDTVPLIMQTVYAWYATILVILIGTHCVGEGVDDHGRGESLVSDLRRRAAAVARVRKSSLRLGIGKIKILSFYVV